MTYHQSIIDLLAYILSKEEYYINHIDAGNAFDKILRNYHQFNHANEKVYRNLKRMQKYYQFSESAWANKGSRKELYFEHLVPIKIIKEKLRDLQKDGNVTKQQIQHIMDLTKIVVISRADQNLVDQRYKTEMPRNGSDRLTAVGIKIAKETIDNDLFKIRN